MPVSYTHAVAGNTMQTATTNAVYFPALDGIRALALGMVFLAHFAHVSFFGVGVNVFFVLSGFLITGILLDSRDRPRRARTFYFRRALRIFPLYYAVFLVLWVSTPVFHWQWNRAWLLWPIYLGNLLDYLRPWFDTAGWRLTSNGVLPGRHLTVMLGHFWSLCVEEQFYLLWPWVVFFLSRRALLWVCALTVAVLPFIRIALGHQLAPVLLERNILFRLLPFQLDSLLLGGLVALVWRGAHRAMLVRLAQSLAPIAVAASLVFVWLRVDLHLGFLHQPHRAEIGYLTWELSLVNLLSALLIVVCLQPGSWIYRMFHIAPARWIGRVSYGGYVLHGLFIGVYYRAAHAMAPRHTGVALVCIGTALSLSMAAVSYRYLERPFLDLKDRFAGTPVAEENV